MASFYFKVLLRFLGNQRPLSFTNEGNSEKCLFKEDIENLQCRYVYINYPFMDYWLWVRVVEHNNYFAFFVFLTYIQNMSDTVLTANILGALLYLFWFVEMEKHEEWWKKCVMPRIYYGLLWKISYNSKIHTCYKWLHRGPSNICCGAKQSCLQMIIAALLKQLGRISGSMDRGLHFKTLRAIYSKLVNHPPKWQSFSIVTWLHGLTKFNQISYLLINFHFWSAGTYSVCIMEENTRLLHC